MSQYNEAGWVRDLPDLLQGRYDHGCSFYDNKEGSQVIRILILITVLSLLIYISDIVGHRGQDWQCSPLFN